MANLHQSLRKRIYEFRVLHGGMERQWNRRYWYEWEGRRVVPCRLCPKFDIRKSACTVPYATPLRKCVAASLESGLRDWKGLRVLEVGCGESSYARKILRRLRSTWVGIDPRQGKAGRRSLRTARGHAADIPFADRTFDAVVGVQTLEHFGEPNENIDKQYSLDDALREIRRVLRPQGRLYLDAPVHLHGLPALIRGEVGRVTGLLRPEQWQDLVVECWRRDFQPLARYAPPDQDMRQWGAAGLSPSEVGLAAAQSVWLLTIKARRA